jgi:hypothetical protein
LKAAAVEIVLRASFVYAESYYGPVAGENLPFNEPVPAAAVVC